MQTYESLKQIHGLGMQRGRGASDAPSCAYAIERAAEIFGVERDGFIKGKSASYIVRVHAGQQRKFVGQHFWARGYWVSTVDKNEAAVRQSIYQRPEKERQTP